MDNRELAFQRNRAARLEKIIDNRNVEINILMRDLENAIVDKVEAQEMVEKLRQMLRYYVTVIDTECVTDDGSTPDTRMGHAILGDFDTNQEEV
jgi:hypothetical protein